MTRTRLVAFACLLAAGAGCASSTGLVDSASHSFAKTVRFQSADGALVLRPPDLKKAPDRGRAVAAARADSGVPEGAKMVAFGLAQVDAEPVDYTSSGTDTSSNLPERLTRQLAWVALFQLSTASDPGSSCPVNSSETPSPLGSINATHTASSRVFAVIVQLPSLQTAEWLQTFTPAC